MAAAAAAEVAHSQVYPNRPIRVVIPFPPGGNVDTFARVLLRYVEEDLEDFLPIAKAAKLEPQ